MRAISILAGRKGCSARCRCQKGRVHEDLERQLAAAPERVDEHRRNGLGHLLTVLADWATSRAGQGQTGNRGL